jgi:hypothetical protein
MKRLFLPAILVTVVCGGFAAGFSWRDPEVTAARQQAANATTAAGKIRESLEASVADLTRERDEAREQREKLDGQVRDLSAKLAQSEANAAALAKTTAQGKVQPPQGSGGNPMKSMAEMFKTPAMKDAMVQQNLAQLDMIYGKLYTRLQLENLDKEDFKKLLGERIRAELEMSIQMMSGEFSPQQSASAVADLKKAKDVNDQKIRVFLNNETDYQTFQKWEQTRPERMMLNGGLTAFAAAGEPLTLAQEDQLVSAMFTARTQPSAVPDLSKPENLTPENLSPKMGEKILANYDAQAAQVLAGAAGYLSPKQLEALKEFQKQQRAMQELGIKMGAAMVGGK